MKLKLKCPSCGNSGDLRDETIFEPMGKYEGRPMTECKNCGLRLVYSVPLFKRFGAMVVGIGVLIFAASAGAVLAGLVFGSIFFLLGLANKPYVIKTFASNELPRIK